MSKPRSFYSFLLALLVHAAIIILAALLVDKRPTTAFIETKSMIQLDVGHGTSKKTSNKNKKMVLASASPSVPYEGSETKENIVTKGVDQARGKGFEENDFEASAVSYKNPTYPRLAIKRGLEGGVRLRIQVSSDGMPEKTEILKSSGHDILDRAALDSIPNWRFQKKPSTYFVEKNILFQLKDAR